MIPPLSELKNKDSARLLKLPGFFAQFFSTSLKFEKRSTERPLALAPASSPPPLPPGNSQFTTVAPSPFGRKQGLGGLQPSRSGQRYPVKSREGDNTGALCFVSFSGVSPFFPWLPGLCRREGYLQHADTGAQTGILQCHQFVFLQEILTYLEGPKNKSGSMACGTFALQALHG